jgi:hypothetical protein
MSHDSASIDNALVAKLGADAVLLSYCPNGVYMDEAPQGMTRFVIVSLVDESDEPVFGSRAYEDALYLVEARLLSTTASANANCKAAAARIDLLLDDQPLMIGSPPAQVAGYTHMLMQRESRIRTTEIDDLDPSLRWFRRGGNYRVVMDVNP